MKKFMEEEVKVEGGREMKTYRIKGTTERIKANCMKQALLKLVDKDGDFLYQEHWYTRSNRKAWARFETSYGYTGIVEEL